MSEPQQDMLTVGDQAPALTLPTMTGQPLHLRDLMGKKYILFMWASW
jgi:peroxiredoxin